MTTSLVVLLSFLTPMTPTPSTPAALMSVPSTVVAATDTIITEDFARQAIGGVWRVRAGDNEAFLDADVAGPDWVKTPVPGVWPEEIPRGHAWMRTTISVPWAAVNHPDLPSRWAKARPVIAVMEAGNAFELYVGGKQVGVFGDVDDEDRADVLRPLISDPIPFSAVTSDGRLEVALRVWRTPAFARMEDHYAGISGADEIWFGRADDIEVFVASETLRAQRQQFLFGPLGFLLFVVGAYHLQLYRRRRQLRDYLWLGLLLMVVAVIFTLHTWWWDSLSLDMGLRIKISMVGGFATCVLFVQFLWPFLGRPLTRRWRVYQGSQIVFGIVTLVVPGLSFMTASAGLRALLWLPWLVMSVVLVLWQASKKNPEALTLLGGLSIFVAGALYAALQSIGVVPVGELDSVMMWMIAGATAFVLSMALSLSNRFVRVYASLDELNVDLEKKNHVLTSMNAAASRFVPSEFLKIIGRENLVEVQRGDHVQREMSVMFSDIRSFTTIVEGMTPDENFTFINNYLSTMEGPIRAEGGFIDSYIGDAIMALFDAGADAAVRAGIGDLRALKDHNADRIRAGERPLRVGIGVSTGQLMLGTIGGKNRINCGVIGDCVNLAARIESMTKMYGASFLISEFTHDRLSDPSVYDIRVVDRVRAKGKTKPVTIYEVLDGLDDDARAARLASRETFEGALKDFQAGELGAASEGFQAVCAGDAADVAARLWVERCTQYTAAGGLPQNFDGVVELLTK